MNQDLRAVIVALWVMTVLAVGCQPTALSQATPTSTLTSSPTALLTRTSTSSPTPILTATRRPTRTRQPTRTPRPLPTLVLGTMSGPFRLVAAIDQVVAGDVRALQSTLDGTLWLITDRSVARLVDSAWLPYLTNFTGQVAGIDAAGRVWVVNEDSSQIAAWDGAGWTAYGAEAGWTALPNDDWRDVRGGQVDALGQLWFVTPHELRVFKQARWTTYTLADMEMDSQQVEDRSTAFKITITQGGRVWIGECDWSGPGPVGGRGARWFDGQIWHGIQSPAASGCVQDIAEDNDGRIWLGINDRLWRYDPATGEWTDFPADDPLLAEAHHWYIASVKLGPDGDPWLAVSICGGASCEGANVLYHVHDGVWTQVGAEGRFTGHDYGPLFDPQGIVWLQWEDALYRIVGDTPELVAPLAPDYGAFDAGGQLWLVVWYEGHSTLWVLDDATKN